MGIELLQLLFYREHDARTKLLASVKLQFTIIGFFFMGGIVGGIFYSALEIRVLLPGTVILLQGIVCDNLKLKVKLYRKHQD